MIVTVNGVGFMISKGENWASEPNIQLQSLSFVWQNFYCSEKGRKFLTSEGDRECPTLVSSRPYIFFQTHSHNVYLKIAGLVRRFLLRRRNMSLSKIHIVI